MLVCAVDSAVPLGFKQTSIHQPHSKCASLCNTSNRDFTFALRMFKRIFKECKYFMFHFFFTGGNEELINWNHPFYLVFSTLSRKHPQKIDEWIDRQIEGERERERVFSTSVPLELNLNRLWPRTLKRSLFSIKSQAVFLLRLLWSPLAAKHNKNWRDKGYQYRGLIFIL